MINNVSCMHYLIVDVQLTSAKIALFVLGVILLCVAIAGCVIIVVVQVKPEKGTRIHLHMYSNTC